MVHFCIQVAMYQIKKGRRFIIENPQTSRMWTKVPGMVKLSSCEGVTWDTLNMCAYGMQDPVSNLYYLKAVTLMHNFPPGALDPIFC